MIIQTWFPPFALLMVGQPIIAFPLSQVPGLDHGWQIPAFAGFGLVRKTPGQRPPGLEAVCQLPADLQYRAVSSSATWCLSLQPWMPLNPDGKGMLFPEHHLSTV